MYVNGKYRCLRASPGFQKPIFTIFVFSFFVLLFFAIKNHFLRKKSGNLGITSETTIPGISSETAILGITSETTETLDPDSGERSAGWASPVLADPTA